MSATTHTISPLRQRMIDDMRMRKLAPKTRTHYLRAVCQFAGFLGRSPDTASVDDLRRYQLYLVDQGTSPVSLNASITGLKFFFEITAGHARLMSKMQPVRIPRTLPVVLSREEVTRLIVAAGNRKHQTALAVANGAGLRVIEGRAQGRRYRCLSAACRVTSSCLRVIVPFDSVSDYGALNKKGNSRSVALPESFLIFDAAHFGDTPEE